MEFKDKSLIAAISKQLGAIPVSETQTRFQVWAPKAKSLHVEVVERSRKQENVVASALLARDEQGIFSGTIDNCPPGSLYRYKLDDKPGRPDPYSRFQPFGVHGPSQVIDSSRFPWTDSLWHGVKKRDLVVYELHVGSFTVAGTYQAASEKLDELVELGITAIELLPIAQTPGRWNWGYDGVNYFAPRNTFGKPDELKEFIDACHHRQIAVILDVVYNHVGPEGNYLNEFGPYRSPKHGTPWGDALNFDARDCEMVREFVIRNVLFWLQEYHFDGLRLDAVHYMFDESQLSIIDETRDRFREYADSIEREVYLIAESNIYDSHLIGDVANGKPHYDAIWSDCLMHSIYSHGNPEVRLTNRKYAGTPDLVQALEHAYVFSAPQAFRVSPEDRRRHHPSGNRQYIESLVMALQTHDSVGNHPHGKRLHHLTDVEFQKAAAPLILLYPSIPMIFMGEEWAAEAPFPFFADFEDQNLRQAVDRGRQDEYPHHDWNGSPLPSDPVAFHSSKLNRFELNQEMQNWYRQLLVFRKQGIVTGWLNVESMKTEHDFSDDVFRLIYEGRNQRVVICCRLAVPDSQVVMIENANSGELVLDSMLTKPSEKTGHDKSQFIQLAPRQSCIWIEARG